MFPNSKVSFWGGEQEEVEREKKEIESSKTEFNALTSNKQNLLTLKIEFDTEIPEDKSFLFNEETKNAVIFQYIIYFSGYYSSQMDSRE